jgi:LPXTG-motif cell wall-anchored protein
MPDVCVVTVGALPATGGEGMLPIALFAVLAVAAGSLILIARRRRRAATSGALAVIAALIVGAVALAAPAPAQASAAVSYDGTCALLAVSDAELSPASARLVPGDSVRVVSAVVTNVTDAPITIELADAQGALTDAVTALTTVDSAEAAAAEVAPGASRVVTLVLTLPTTAGNALQGVSTAVALVVTATQS